MLAASAVTKQYILSQESTRRDIRLALNLRINRRKIDFGER
jgi:hypothetical protein